MCWCQWRFIRWTTQCQCNHWNDDSFFPKPACLKGKHGVSGRGIVASLDTFKPKRKVVAITPRCANEGRTFAINCTTIHKGFVVNREKWIGFIQMEPRLRVGGPVVKMWFFRMTPIPLLSVLIYSNGSQYVILKVSLKKIEQNLPVGCVKHWIVSH